MRPTIYSFSDLERCLNKNSRVLVLFSGGLDGTYLIKKLISDFGVSNVIALTVNLGGIGDNLNAKNIAEQLGAESIFLDKRTEFAKDFVIPALKVESYLFKSTPDFCLIEQTVPCKSGCRDSSSKKA